MLQKCNIVFLGPHQNAMAALGDKVASSILAQSAGVPTLPWSGLGVTLGAPVGSKSSVEVPHDVYQAACVHSVEDAVESCNRIGYPAMLKVQLLLSFPSCSAATCHAQGAPRHALLVRCCDRTGCVAMLEAHALLLVRCCNRTGCVAMPQVQLCVPFFLCAAATAPAVVPC